MRRKVWLAILLVAAFGLVAQGATVIQTQVEPTGGPYTSVSSDNRIESQNPGVNYGPTTTQTKSLKLRNVSGNPNRQIISIMRFDLSSVAGRNLTDATFSHTITWETGSTTNTYTLDVWGIIDGVNDNWDSSTLTWNTAAGALGWLTWTTDGSGTYQNYSVNTSKWQRLGSVTFTVTGGSPNLTVTSNTTDLNLDSFMAADTNGLVTLALMPGVSGHWCNNASADECAAGTFPDSYRPTLTFPNSDVAANPQPANGSSVDKNSITQLSWTNVPDVYKCDVYMGTEPNILHMDKLTFNPAVESVNINDFSSFSTPLNEGTYYWRIDGYANPDLPNDPNYEGKYWSFTATSIPIITQQTTPTELILFAGETAEFSIGVNSSTTVTYTWYRSPDNVNNTPDDDVAVGTNSPTLTLTGLAGTDEGYYYCQAKNSGGSVVSNTAHLGVKRKVAHWTLDELVGGQYADSSGEGHNADPNGTPVFVAGAGATTGNGVVIDSVNGYASAGTWNPSAHTGQWSVSLWAKWAGQPTGAARWQGLIAKENTFGTATMMWQLEVDQNNNNLAYKNGSSTAVTSTPLPVGTWEHVVVTVNGSTVTIYRNGVSAVSGTLAQGTLTTAPVVIGASMKAADTGLFNWTFNGVLDDVRLYNYALTWNEIIDVYHSVSGQSICTNRPTYDFTGDCLTTMADFAVFASQWMECGMYPECP